MMPPFSDALLADALSSHQAKFLTFVERHPEALERSSFHLDRPGGDLHLERFLSLFVPLQPWPVFIDGALDQKLESVSVMSYALVRSLTERVFGNHPERLCTFYGLDPSSAATLGAILDLPWGPGGETMRGDFVFSGGELKCLELNATANAAGLFNHQAINVCLQEPLIRRFLDEQGMKVRFRDPWRNLLRMMIERATARDLHRSGCLNLGIVFHRPEVMAPALPIIEPQYHALLARLAPGVRGRVIFCHVDQLRRDGEVLRAGQEPLQIVMQGQQNYSDVLIADPSPPIKAWLDGIIDFYPGPLTWIYSDKRNLALLSALADEGELSREETAWVAAHLPWGRIVEPGSTVYRGERSDLQRLLLNAREHFVLKPAQSASGVGIQVGRYTSPEEWEDLVRSAFEYPGTYSVQEYIDTDLELYQWDGKGCELCATNWGLFVAGDRFGGAYLRVCPPPPDGIVNVGNGAQDGCFLELVPADQEVAESPCEMWWDFSGSGQEE